jgi:stage V sporulation protein R
MQVAEPDFIQLEKAVSEIWEVAQRLGLDPFPVHFEMVPASIMYEFGAYGLPGRFSHWTHGRTYQQIKTMYDYGLSKIYELVVNSNPAYAFLLENNSVLQNKVVVAHVLAHSDFFKHNVYFDHTSRAMIERASINAERIQRYEFEHGLERVESFLDAVLSIQEHFDPHPRFRRTDPGEKPSSKRPAVDRPYEDLLSLGEQTPAEAEPGPKRFPPEPEKDLLGFLADHSPDLEDWQRDVLQIVRAEQIYFLPQMQTKLLNEGWAAYWHARIVREMNLDPEEHMQFARMHAGVLEPSRRSINPYYVGMKLFEDIERRWDTPSAEEAERHGRPGGQGREKIFEVRQLESDASFLRNYLTKDLVEELDLYLYRLEDGQWVVVEKNWEKVRDSILTSMTNFGQPYIVVEDADYGRNRELYLKHCFEGQELDISYANRTMQQVHKLWGRTVHLQTVVEEKPTLLSFDGQQSSARPLLASP